MNKTRIKEMLEQGGMIIRTNELGLDIHKIRMTPKHQVTIELLDSGLWNCYELKDEHLQIWLIGFLNGRNRFEFTDCNAEYLNKLLIDVVPDEVE